MTLRERAGYSDKDREKDAENERKRETVRE